MGKFKELFAKYTKDWKKTLLHLFLVIAGSVILGLGTGILLVPYNIITGGLSGIGIILNKTLGWNVELVVAVLTWLFFFMGLIFLGKKFAFQTLCSTIVYPIALSLGVFLQNNIEFLQLVKTNEVHRLLAAVFGGVFVGAGCAITFLGGGSTGGVDIPALMAQKYLKIKCSIMTFAIDATIIIVGLVINKDLIFAMIGILSAVIAAVMVDKIFLGGTSAYIATIISKKYEEINNFILDKLERGTTIIDVEGGYSKEESRMIQVAFVANEYAILQEGVSLIDPKAFMTVCRANEVMGEGFNKFVRRKRKLKIKEEDK